MLLNNKQLENFYKDGFLVIRDFLEKEECDEIINATQKHIDNMIEPIESEQEYLEDSNTRKTTLRRLRQVYDREEVFQKWMTNKNIRPILEQILNEKAILTLAHHNSIMTKMPKESSRTTWHQDRRYWHFENDNLLSVWLALDDEYLENGLLEFIPGSHKLTLQKDQFDDKSNFLDELPINQEIIKKRAHTNLQKGDIVLFHCKTLHAASKNITDNPKISFVYTVRGINNKPIKNTRSDFKEVILD